MAAPLRGAVTATSVAATTAAAAGAAAGACPTAVVVCLAAAADAAAAGGRCAVGSCWVACGGIHRETVGRHREVGVQHLRAQGAERHVGLLGQEHDLWTWHQGGVCVRQGMQTALAGAAPLEREHGTVAGRGASEISGVEEGTWRMA